MPLLRKGELNTLTAILMLPLLHGCASQWVNLDGSAAAKAEIDSAKEACQVDDILYDLSYKELASKAAQRAVKDKAAKEGLATAYKNTEIKTQQKIEDCMMQNGLKKK